jgi:hypothetical protein
MMHVTTRLTLVYKLKTSKHLFLFTIVRDVIINRPYSKVNKSTRTKVAVIFAHFRFSVISLLLQQSKSEFASIQAHTFWQLQQHKKQNYTRPELGKNNYHFYPC